MLSRYSLALSRREGVSVACRASASAERNDEGPGIFAAHRDAASQTSCRRKTCRPEVRRYKTFTHDTPDMHPQRMAWHQIFLDGEQ